MALRIAESCNGAVINADASQVYADLRILSARPDKEETARAPHRLYGHVDGAVAFSAARWAQTAAAEINLLHARKILPILVGGSGLYIRTLLDGIAPVPDIDPQVRTEVRDLPVAQAYAALSLEDPEAAARLNARDTTRVSRALEVVRSTGRPLGQWHARTAGGIAGSITLHPLILLPERDWLMGRCDARFDAMIAQGAADEVSTLLARRLPKSLPVMPRHRR